MRNGEIYQLSVQCVKKAPHWDTVCPLEVRMKTQLSPFLIHRFAVPLLNYGMIATGNHYNSDSLRDAPPPGEGIIPSL